MKTSIVTVAVLILFGAVAATAGLSPLNPAMCARTMCTAMRSCSTYVPQPTPQYEKTEKPTKTAVTDVNKSKGSSQVQGEGGGNSCRFQAFLDFQECMEGGQQGGRVEQPNTKPGNAVKPEVSATPKK